MRSVLILHPEDKLMLSSKRVSLINHRLSSTALHMKRWLTPAALITVAALTLHSATTNAALVGHWSFDDATTTTTLLDDVSIAGSDNNGTQTAGTTAAGASGVLGGALELFGNQNIDVGSSTDFDTQTWTASMWLLNDPGITNFRTAFGCWSPQALHIGRKNTGIWSDYGGGETSGTTVVDNQWFHIVSRRTPNTQENSLWVDGIKQALTSNNAPAIPGTSNLYIGTKDGAGNDWDGKIDDLGYFTTALTDDEIRELYVKAIEGRNLGQSRVPPSSGAGLIAHWTFDGTNPGGTFSELALLADSVGSNHGANNNVNPVAQATGQLGNALELDGTNEVAVSNATGNFNHKTYTVSTWLNTDTLDNWRTAFGDWTGGETWSHFGLDATGDKWSNHAGGATLGTTTAVTGQWYHVVSVVEEGVGRKIWVDGKLEANLSGTAGALTNPGAQVFIGTKGLGGNPWDGKIDDLAVWSQALSDDEVRKVHNNATLHGRNAGQPWGGAVSPAAGLVSYYSFDGDATARLEDTASDYTNSSSTNDDNLSEVGTTISYVSGQVGQAADLAGGYFTAPNVAVDDIDLPNTFTIEAWINPDNVAKSWNRLVLNWGGGQTAYHFGLRGNDVNLHLGNGTTTKEFTGGNVAQSVWQHIAATSDGTTVRLYLDGIEVDSDSLLAGAPIAAASENLGIGDSAGGPGASYRFDGRVDELAMWDVALSADQIASHYLSGASGYGLTLVPEPSSLLLLAMGLVFATGFRRKWRP